MSSYTSRPRVKSVNVSPLALGAVVFAAKALSSVISVCMTGASQALDIVQESLDLNTIPDKLVAPQRMVSEHTVQLKQSLNGANAASLSEAEKIKISTVAHLSVSNHFVEVTPDYQKLMDSLAQAQTAESAQQAAAALVDETGKAHAKIFNKAVMTCVERALVSNGFSDISKMNETSNDSIRVVGTDDKGRSIVTEICQCNDDTRMEYEVVGVTDKSCEKIMDAFDEALDRAGLKSDPPKRKFTGGITVLPAAKELAIKKMKKYTTPISKREPFATKENKKAPKISSRRAQLVQSRSS